MKLLCYLFHSWKYLFEGRFRRCQRCSRLEERRPTPAGDWVYRELRR